MSADAAEYERLLVENERLRTDNVRLTRAVEQLESFAGAVAHDLKGPLATVDGCVQLLTHLEFPFRPPAEFGEFLSDIAHGVETMLAMIDGFLAYATANEAPLERASVDLAGLVADVANRHVDHQRHLGQPVPHIRIGPLPRVNADGVMLRQVVDNLIGNAVKYTQPGCPATVDISARRENSDWVRIEVADHGIGVPAGHHEAIFATFHRAHPEAGYVGTGLGLSICQRIVRRHGGDIGCRPNPDGGVRFWLTLPAAPGAVALSKGSPLHGSRAA